MVVLVGVIVVSVGGFVVRGLVKGDTAAAAVESTDFMSDLVDLVGEEWRVKD